MAGCVLCILFALTGVALHFYGEHIRHECYLANRAAFIEQHKETQYVLGGMTFCYEPRGGQLREAVYKGNNLYRVKQWNP